MWIDCSNCFKRYQLFIRLSPADSIAKIRGFIYTHQFLSLTMIERRRRGWHPMLYQRKGGCMASFLTWTPCFVPSCLFGESGHFSSCAAMLRAFFSLYCLVKNTLSPKVFFKFFKEQNLFFFQKFVPKLLKNEKKSIINIEKEGMLATPLKQERRKSTRPCFSWELILQNKQNQEIMVCS